MLFLFSVIEKKGSTTSLKSAKHLHLFHTSLGQKAVDWTYRLSKVDLLVLKERALSTGEGWSWGSVGGVSYEACDRKILASVTFLK